MLLVNFSDSVVCERYWPKKADTVSVEDFDIHLESSTVVENKGWVVRKIKLSSVSHEL